MTSQRPQHTAPHPLSPRQNITRAATTPPQAAATTPGQHSGRSNPRQHRHDIAASATAQYYADTSSPRRHSHDNIATTHRPFVATTSQPRQHRNHTSPLRRHDDTAATAHRVHHAPLSPSPPLPPPLPPTPPTALTHLPLAQVASVVAGTRPLPRHNGEGRGSRREGDSGVLHAVPCVPRPHAHAHLQPRVPFCRPHISRRSSS
jgi:hypothetical protein